MQIGLPLPNFESEGFEDRNCQYHESGTDESDSDGFFMIFVHTAAKVLKLSEKYIVNSEKLAVVRHIFVLFIPENCKNMLFSLSLHSEMINLTELRNEYEHETKNSFRRPFCCCQSAEARNIVGHSPLELV